MSLVSRNFGRPDADTAAYGISRICGGTLKTNPVNETDWRVEVIDSDDDALFVAGGTPEMLSATIDRAVRGLTAPRRALPN